VVCFVIIIVFKRCQKTTQNSPWKKAGAGFVAKLR